MDRTHSFFLFIIMSVVLLVGAAPSYAVNPPVTITNTTATSQPQPLSFSPDWLNGVVIVVYGSQYGTGFWINQQYIATAAHVVSYTPNAQVTIIRGSTSSPGRVVALDRNTDVAVIMVQNPDQFNNKHIFPIARSMPEPTSIIYILGYPAELLQVSGNLNALSEHPRVLQSYLSWADNGLIELGGSTDAGNSGGPVVDYGGNVIGLVSFALRGEAGTLYFATSAGNLKQLCRQHNIPYEEGSSGILPSSIANNPAAVAAVTAAGVNLVMDATIILVGVGLGAALVAGRKRKR